MQKLKVNELKEHPQNTYYFDEMEGEKWKEFLESVKTSGIIEPIVCTQDKIIVSGHQRVRACKELKIEEIDCEIRIYEDENKIIKDLLETNIRQRGEIGGSSIKIGRRIRELEKLYGIKRGNNQYNELSDNVGVLTQQDIAKQLNISVDSLNNYKKLTTLIPELQDMVEDDKVSFSVASRILTKLTKEEQKDLINTYSKDVLEYLSMSKAKEIIEQYKEQSKQETNKISSELAVKNKELNEKINKLSSLQVEVNNLQQQLNNRPTIEIEKEIIPEDYNSTKKMLSDYKIDYSNIRKQFEDKSNELNKLKNDLETMKQNTPQEQFNKKIKDSTIFFCARVSEFLEKVGGYAWIIEHINELPEYERKSYLSAVNAISAWSENLRENINK